MSAAIKDRSVDASCGVEEPAIITWFNWAEKLTTGLGSKTQWTATEENSFDAVLHLLRYIIARAIEFLKSWVVPLMQIPLSHP